MNKLMLLLLLMSSVNATKKDNKVFITRNGQVTFYSKATLELIKATSSELKGALDINTKKFLFKVDVRTFKGFNSELQREHFNENYIQSEKFPEASFDGKIIEDIDYSKPGNYTIRAKGKFTMHGIEQERIIKCELEVISTNKLKVHASFSVLLADHNIPIPKIVNEKLSEEIKVDISAELNAQ